uniref:Translational initiation factor 1 n=1 Tax=Cucumis melo TaxID=3656 RepID=A0A9I9EEF1_CUCME
MKKQKRISEGFITESPTNDMFWICLYNEDPILGYVSGRIQHSLIHILVSCYDSTKTRRRIIYRLRNKDSND